MLKVMSSGVVRIFVGYYILFLQWAGLGTRLVGASLSEPHTSGTALRKCVCIYACLRPYTVKKFFKANLNISRKLNVQLVH